MQPIPRGAVVAVVCAIGLTLLNPRPAWAQFYTYQGLADTRPSSKFVNFGPAAINDSGDIAFAASLKNGGSGIYKWSAAMRTLVTIFEDPGVDWLNFHHAFPFPVLTPGGKVIFQYQHERIHVGDGGMPDVLVDSSYGVELGSDAGPYDCEEPLLVSRTATSGGNAVITCSISDGRGGQGYGIYLTNNGGALQRVCDVVLSGAAANRFDRCFFPGPIEVSPNGTLAGIGFDRARLDQFGQPRQILMRGMAGLEILLDPGVHTGALAFPGTLSHLGINDAGTVTFDALQETAPTSGYAVFRIDVPGAPVSVTDPRNLFYRFAMLPSINALGEIVFFDQFQNGIFNGPDPVANKVLGRTDTIPGYAIPGVTTSVSTVIFQHPGINRRGEIAAIGFLADGTLVITRITPPTNHPPDVTFGDQSSPEGSPVTVQVVASDQDGDYPLAYAIEPTPGNLAPVGTLAAVPPGLSIDTATGDIVGTPAPGTAGNRYAVRIIVSDSRGLTRAVDVVWTITAVLPPARLNVVATTNRTAEAIDVSWQNPTPDSAQEFWLGYSTTGIAGPFAQWGFGPLAQTSQQFTDPLGSGRVYCFTAKGVVTDNGNRIFSLDSNIACTNYPIFSISGPLLPSSLMPGVVSTATGASFVVTTTMPADLMLSWASEPPAGAQVTVTPNGDHTMFTIGITNLPSAETQTSYSVTLSGRTRLVGLLASRDVPFVTTALPPPPPGPIQVGNSSPLRVQARNFAATGQAMIVTVELRNTSPSTIANIAIVPTATTLEVDAGSLRNRESDLVRQHCQISPEGTVATCSPISVMPESVGTVTRGHTSQPITLAFPLATLSAGEMIPGAFVGVAARLKIAVTYDPLNGAVDPLPEVRPKLPE